MTIETTLNKIREHSPCEDGWEKLLKSLGKTKADDEPLAFSTIIESNGIDDAIWCLRSICPEHDREIRLFAADCADSVLHIFEKTYPNDNRPRLAIEAARAFANGEISQQQLNDAWAAARDARDAAWAAWAAKDASAARDARDAVWDATWAAREAAWAAASDAAWAAAWATARDAARAARAARAAARDATWAAREAAWAAKDASAARDAVWEDARDAAWDAAIDAQTKMIIERFS